MNPPDHPCQATPAGDLRQQIMDSRVPKNEREWWASREIEKLERELTSARSERDLAITRVACILWSGAIDKHTCGDVQKWADYYTAELTRLRAEVERWQTVAATMSQEREHNANEASRLRAEVERLTAKIGNQADRIRYLEGATNHATGTPLSQAIARAEKAEASAKLWEADALRYANNTEFWKARAEKAEAELITERARLDYLGLHMGMPQVSEALNLPFSQCFPIRDAIDLAMKNETTTP